MIKTSLKLFGALFIISMLSSCGYNGMVNRQEAVNKAWANVQASYQRRSDLIPNLVNTVQGSANFEKSTLTAVIEARAKATSVNIDASKLNEDNMKQFQAAQGQLSSSLSRLLVSVEKYPDLQTTQSFRDLSAELAGTENRINKSRTDYNTAVNDYNSYIKGIPEVLFANSFGFKPKPYFEADAGSQKAPTVKF